MRQRDHHKTAALQELAQAAERIEEMRGILLDDSRDERLVALLVSYQGTMDCLTAGLRQSVIHLADEADDSD